MVKKKSRVFRDFFLRQGWRHLSELVFLLRRPAAGATAKTASADSPPLPDVFRIEAVNSERC